MNEKKDLNRQQDEKPYSLYERFLHLDILLNLQKTADEQLHPDELVFQIVHQTFELWWKVTAQFLQRAYVHLQSGNINEAGRLICRASAIQTVVMQSMRQLESLTPLSFLSFRDSLGNASGASSPGYHAIRREALALWSAFPPILEQKQVTLLDIYLRSDEHADLYVCAEALIDFDEQIQLFRAAHLRVAKRYLGLQASGTGGSSIVALEKTQAAMLFPALWHVRTSLLEHME